MSKFLAGLAVAAGLMAGAAAAQSCIPQSTVSSSGVVTYQICDVPDIDQFRATFNVPPYPIPGLPNDGKMYCGPTSIMNWMAYMANHGRPSLMPGPNSSNWAPEPVSQEPNYLAMTEYLRKMGVLMHTDPLGGTNGDGLIQGTDCWLYGSSVTCTLSSNGYPLKISSPLVSNYWAAGFYSPTAADMVNSGVAGSLITPVIGWYKSSGAGFARDGGHVVTLVSGFLAPSVKSVGFHDPADGDGDWLTQSPFYTNPHGVTNTTALFDGMLRTQSRLGKYTSAFLDGYVAIRPPTVMTSGPSAIDVYKGPLSEPEASAAHHTGVILPTTQIVSDFAIHPEKTVHPYLVQGSDAVYQFDELAGASSQFAGVTRPKRLVFGGSAQQLHVLGDRQITTLDRNGQAIARVTLADPADAIAYDAQRGLVIALTARTGALSMFTTSLVSRGTLSIAPLACSGVIARVEPRQSVLWALCPGDTALTRVDLTAMSGANISRVPLQGSRGASSFAISDGGWLMVSEQGQLQVYDGRGGRTVTPFSGVRAGAVVDVLHAFSNFDPQTMRGPAYRNVLPQDAGQ